VRERQRELVAVCASASASGTIDAAGERDVVVTNVRRGREARFDSTTRDGADDRVRRT